MGFLVLEEERKKSKLSHRTLRLANLVRKLLRVICRSSRSRWKTSYKFIYVCLDTNLNLFHLPYSREMSSLTGRPLN